jgi:hypothetical protein
VSSTFLVQAPIHRHDHPSHGCPRFGAARCEGVQSRADPQLAQAPQQANAQREARVEDAAAKITRASRFEREPRNAAR